MLKSKKMVLFLVFSLIFTFSFSVMAVTLRVSTNHPESTPSSKGLEYFAERIDTLTDGEVELKIYYNAVLGGEREALESLQAGAIDLARVSTGHLGSFVPMVDIFSVPYLFEDQEHYHKIIDGHIGQEIAAYVEEADMKLLVWMDAGSRSIYNNVRPIRTPEDLKDLKIRVMGSDVMIKTIEAFDASPTTTSFAEVYNALQTNVIDGAENSAISVDSMKHDEVAKYFSLDEHMMIPDVLVISRETWNELTGKQKASFLRVSQETQEFVKDEWAKQRQEAMDSISENMEINEVEDKSAFVEVVKPLQKELSPQFDGYIERIQSVVE